MNEALAIVAVAGLFATAIVAIVFRRSFRAKLGKSGFDFETREGPDDDND